MKTALAVLAVIALAYAPLLAYDAAPQPPVAGGGQAAPDASGPDMDAAGPPGGVYDIDDDEDSPRPGPGDMKRGDIKGMRGGRMHGGEMRGGMRGKAPHGGMMGCKQCPMEDGKRGMMGGGFGGGFPGMDKIAEQVRQTDAAFADRLEKMRKDAPNLFHALLRNIGPKMFFFAASDKEARVKAIAVVSLDADILELSQSYREASSADKTAIKKKMEAKLAQQFDAKLALDQARVDNLSGELAKLKSRIEKRKSQKSDLVSKRLDEITGEAEPW
ncbi:MAG: hypothetical protein WC421_04560 [Elusimicrobiales bacterium]